MEAASIRAQARLYARLPDIRAMIPDDSGLDSVEPFLAPLMTVTAFDLGQGRLTAFSAYRFLYERLIGAENDILSDDTLVELLKGKGFDLARRTVAK